MQQLQLPTSLLTCTHPARLLLFVPPQTAPACIDVQKGMLRPHEPSLLHSLSAVAGSSGDNSSSSPALTCGLAADNAAMLAMLAQGRLLAGPLLLALQVFAVKATAQPLVLPPSDALDEAPVARQLEELSEEQQLRLRRFLFKVRCCSDRLAHASACTCVDALTVSVMECEAGLASCRLLLPPLLLLVPLPPPPRRCCMSARSACQRTATSCRSGWIA